ncbi:MAG: Wzz/FepE/Etk N-terminal domain-containing protein [Chitinophagia bacterium]|jgi:hypothetical protein
MSTENTPIQNPYDAPFSFGIWINDWVKKITVVVKTQYKLIFIIAILGALLGLAYSQLKSTRYKSDITFLVEESKASGGGLLSSLGGQFGMDISSLTGAGNNVLSGDNVLELLKSHSFMTACLKTPYKNDSTYCLADAYADVYKLRKKWQDDNTIGRAIYFAQPDKDLRLQDSLLKTIVKRIEEKEIGVVKVDKKLGFFNVTIDVKDELLSKLMSERILKIATDFYIDAKVGRLKKNVNRLERRTDSISAILNKRTYTATEDARLLLNVNPADVNAPVYSEISQRDKMVLSTIYAELMKNLEVSKMTLAQETPTIQIVDNSVFPLENDEIKWYKGLFAGFFLSLLASILVLVIKEK